MLEIVDEIEMFGPNRRNQEISDGNGSKLYLTFNESFRNNIYNLSFMKFEVLKLIEVLLKPRP